MRAGYTPQEEQATYQPAMAKLFASAPKCPGMDADTEAELKAGSAQTGKTKTQKKNEKRNAKKHEGSESSSNPGGESQKGSEASKPPAAAANSECNEPPEVKLQKEVRKLNKKIREASALTEKEAKGEALTEQEKVKAGNIPSWQDEVDKLEAEINALTT